MTEHKIVFGDSRSLNHIKDKFLDQPQQNNEDKITDESSTETKQNNENKIPNSLEQLRQNLAYSLEITKNRLMLPNNYPFF